MGFLSWLLALLYIGTYLKNPSNTILAKDNMTACQSLKDGQTLVSSNQRFELGFFSPSHQKNRRYLGIWYKGIEPLTVVWVATTEKTLQISKARLQLECNGALALFDRRHSPIFIYNPTKNVTNPYLQILDTGNLRVRDDFTGDVLWQSFDYPSDTMLPGMSIGWRYKPYKSFVLTSWKNASDPSPGDFTLGLDKPQFPQMLLQKKSTKLSRWGPWKGDRFSGNVIFGKNQFIFSLLNTSDDKVLFTYDVLEEANLVRLQVTQFGKIQFLSWKNTSKKWVPVMSFSDFCDDYNACGPYGICHNEKPNCRCLEGFVPNKSPDRHQMTGAGGCEREKIRQTCDGGEHFKRFDGLKLPDNAVMLPNLNSSQCEKKCLEECNCNAYSYIYVYENGTSNCVVWYDDLIDMGYIPNGGDNLNIRMTRLAKLDVAPKASIPPPSKIPPSNKGKKKKLVVIIIVSSVSVLGFSVLLFIRCSRMRTTRRLDQQCLIQRNRSRNEEESMDFRLFEIDVISVATNDFSYANKIGEGGFGPVYKGVLHNGQEIAVKRLCSRSGQGQEQFENESGLIAKLRHRNLVKLVGCCVHEVERMLVYEYLSNKSLEKFIFDPARKMLLSWATRSDIILGIAKGLAYLHGDSGMNIVHRDLKASNILLDSAMTPKISDFGMAKILGDDNELLNAGTSKVHGTHGYIAPEYQTNGQFSTKSDVFSFGVLVLEIISGKRNREFELDRNTSLLGHAWDLWREGDPMEMMDTSLGELPCETKFLRLVQIGLLCAQQNPEHRPTMSDVVCMLMNGTMPLPEPTVPGFLSGNPSLNGIVRPLSGSFNGLTITNINAR